MTNKQTKDCSTGKFKRLNYYHGMLLTEQDFQAEQYYFREKMKLHNRMHGYGVVWGLEITSRCTKIDGKPVHKIFIEPGFALDCEGNEIIVCHPYQVPIDEKLDQLTDSCQPLNPCTKLLIAIRYCECKSAPQPQYASGCGDEDQQVQFSRIGEGFSVQVLLEDEVPDCCKHKQQDECCEKHKQDCPGLAVCCEEEHAIILGCINLVTQEDKITCDKSFEAAIAECKKNLEIDLQKCIEKDTSNEATQACQAAAKTKWADCEAELRKKQIELVCEKNNIKQLLAAKIAERNFVEKYIDPCCKPPRICKPCPTPQEKWEQQKQRLLHQAREALGGIDYCGVIGKSVCDAEQYLKEIGLKPVTETKMFDEKNKKQLLRVIENADCMAAHGQSIVLITDEQEHCVVFAYVQAKD